MAENATTLVYTRCVFFRHEDTTILEQQVNHFLLCAPLAGLKHMETNIFGADVLVTLWFEPMPGATNINTIYEEALQVGQPRGASVADLMARES